MNDEEIVRTYSGMIYRIAYGYAQNEADRNDIFQEVFLTYFKKKRRFNSEEHRKSWLIRVTINCARDFFAKRMKYVEFEDVPPSALKHEDDTEAGDLLDAVTKLPDDIRNIVYMYYFEDLSTKEIADILTMNQNTVITKLSSGRSKLKKFLGDGTL